jgi:hypothetical protein
LIRSHQTKVEVCPSPSLEEEAGAQTVLKGRVSCPSGCELGGRTLRILAQDAVIAEAAVTPPATSEEFEIPFRVPVKTGAYSLRIVCAADESGAVRHEEGSAAFSLIVQPHKTSLAVWDIPSPVIKGAPSALKVGVKCSAGCVLAGREVELLDESGARVASAPLGVSPWPATTALYWVDLVFDAPATPGRHSWMVRFSLDEPEPLHEGVSSLVPLVAAPPPEYCVTVRIADKDTRLPLGQVEVRVGVYRASTDEAGMARVEVPGATYELNVWKQGYESLSVPLKVDSDQPVSLDLIPAPEPDDPYWMWDASRT